MVLPAELIETARKLVGTPESHAPADIRRAISTAYYALFHALCRIVADTIAGPPGPERPERAWHQVYRALNHGRVRDRLVSVVDRSGVRLGFPPLLAKVATTFAALQESRHLADYDPRFEPFWFDATIEIDRAEEAIGLLAELEASHRTALAVWLLLDAPRSGSASPVDARAARR
jgi:hypothetical protein